ncbi:hypothetical protein [Candidatus Lokiarchaeum ossiferum]|uniref:hypothetical protein n=1 Tax=Candidatus Lokiarchaeum ossiferum TaxID=2951803 RepID=UPI00352D6246
MDSQNLSKEEQFILQAIQEHGQSGKSIGYKELQNICADEFEGVRLILKKMKAKKIVDFEGMIPGFAAIITLL